MVCKMAKKGVAAAALGAGLLYVLFGTSSVSYVKTAFHKVRNAAQDSVPVQFEIDRARQQVAELEPAIHKNIEEIAKAEVEIEHLGREIELTQVNLDSDKKMVLALRQQLEANPIRLTRGGVAVPADEVKAELARRYDHYQTVKAILEDKQKTLELRKTALEAARAQNARMRAARAELLTQIERIETRLKQIEATQANNEFTFDDSALARAKATITDLEKRVEVLARVTEQEGRFVGEGVPFDLAPGRDVVKEVDDEFGGSCPADQAPAPSAGRSL